MKNVLTKKTILICLIVHEIFAANAQQLNSRIIDSIAQRHDLCKTILLFDEIHDTTDQQTGQIYTQRISIYYDRIHKQLRDIDVYNFDKKIDAHKIQNIFKKQKQIPPSSHIVYTFFNCILIKVKIQPSKVICGECVGEYYFNQGTLITKKEKNVDVSQRNFINEASFCLAKLELTDKNLVQCMR